MALGSLGRADLNELLNRLGWTMRADGAKTASTKNEADGSGETGAAAKGGEAGDTAQISPRVQVQLLQIRALYEATFQVSQETGAAMGADGQSRTDFNSQLADILAKHVEALAPAEDGETPLDKLAAMFTPEATAGRIFDFASSWYGQWLKGGEDTSENRQAFADYIGAAVEKGFKEAQGILGKLPDEVQGGIDQTHSSVWEKINDFIANGLTKSPEELAAAQGAGRAFNATFAAAGNDPVELMREVLDRLSADGTLRLDTPPATELPGKNLDLTT
jgi:hypothetical protein